MGAMLTKSLLLVIAATAIASRSSAQQPTPGNTLSGAQAFITPDSARFVFPRQANDSYEWDVPIPGVSGGGGFDWEVMWEVPATRIGIDPCGLWLVQWWKTGGPRRGALTELIEWLRLNVIVRSAKDPLAYSFVRKVDQKNIFATVDDGRLVFIVRGADAVRQIFPTIPSQVTFRAIIETTKTPQHKWGAGSVHDYKTVMVNNPNSPEVAEKGRPICVMTGDDWSS